MTRCSVLECKNNSSTKNLLRSGVSYHRFPKDPNAKEKWIAATGRVNWMPTKSSCICSEHFVEKDFHITKKGYRYIDQLAVPTKKIMCYQDATTSNSSKKRILEEPGPSSERLEKKAYIELDQLQKDSVTSIKPTDEITIKKIETSLLNKSPSSSLYSTPRKKKLSSMLRWTRSKITKKDLKIKRLQAQNRRLKRRLENMEQLLKTLEEKFCFSNEKLTCLKYTNVEVQQLLARQAKSGESGFISKRKYSPELRCFALTLNFYSPKAYNYVRNTFNTCLPHPRTLRKW